MEAPKAHSFDHGIGTDEAYQGLSNGTQAVSSYAWEDGSQGRKADFTHQKVKMNSFHSPKPVRLLASASFGGFAGRGALRASFAIHARLFRQGGACVKLALIRDLLPGAVALDGSFFNGFISLELIRIG
jgi:hypothetical protein